MVQSWILAMSGSGTSLLLYAAQRKRLLYQPGLLLKNPELTKSRKLEAANLLLGCLLPISAIIQLYSVRACEQQFLMNHNIS
jgi:hypothetical protein